MPKPSVETLLADPDFQSLDIEGKREILSDVSDSFKALAPESQNQALNEIGQLTIAPAIDPRADSRLARDQALAEREALGQEFVRQEQRPTLEKAIQGALGTGQALVKPLVSIAKGALALPEVAGSPSKIIPTLAEASRRVGMDINSLALALPELIYKYGTLPGNIQRLGEMAPRTPSSQEVEKFLERQPFEQELQKERQTVAFKGAQPELSEAIAQATELAPPLKGAQLFTKGINVATAPVERIIRSSLKPSKQIATRIETATKNTISDIYHAAPDADKLASMPLEGFQQAVNKVKKTVGAEIDQGLKQSGAPLTAGDEIAAKLNSEADSLKRQGQSPDKIKVLTDRAANFAGQVTDMDSLRGAVTSALRENSPLFTRTREAAAPLLAQAETIANKIIAETGGAIENKALEAIKGPEGATLRKKWSDLTLVEKQASDQLNKIINSGKELPLSAQSAMVDALTSAQGAVGLFGLINGWASAAPALVGAAVRSWAKRQSKALKDSNALMTSAYEKLRANPPPIPKKTVNLIPQGPSRLPDLTTEEILNQRIAESIQPTSIAPAPSEALNAIIERTLREQAAPQAGSSVGFF